MDWTEFNKRFPTEESCRNYLFKKKWTDGFCCPKCECKKYWLLSVLPGCRSPSDDCPDGSAVSEC